MNKIKTALNQISLNLSDEQVGKLYHFYELVVEFNKSVNLTAITEYDDFILKHYVDSLYITLLNKEITNKKYILDLGTGGGFPGIPLAIACPESQFVLLDSLNKRIRFLSDSVAELSLKNVTPLHGRAEEFGHNPKYREQFDLCVSRAVANLSTLSEYALPFVKVGGTFVAYKGNAEEEIKKAKSAFALLGGKIKATEKYFLTENGDERNIIEIEKIKPTPNTYPRGNGKIRKAPL